MAAARKARGSLALLSALSLLLAVQAQPSATPTNVVLDWNLQLNAIFRGGLTNTSAWISGGLPNGTYNEPTVPSQLASRVRPVRAL